MKSVCLAWSVMFKPLSKTVEERGGRHTSAVWQKKESAFATWKIKKEKWFSFSWCHWRKRWHASSSVVSGNDWAAGRLSCWTHLKISSGSRKCFLGLVCLEATTCLVFSLLLKHTICQGRICFYYCYSLLIYFLSSDKGEHCRYVGAGWSGWNQWSKKTMTWWCDELRAVICAGALRDARQRLLLHNGG